MIKDILVKKHILHFHEPFQIAYEKVEQAEVVVLKIVDNEGYFGLGSAAPDSEVTGETVERVYKILQQKLDTKFFNYPVDKWYLYHEKIQAEFIDFPSIQSAVEEAVLNLYCQRKNISLQELFGGYRDSCETSVTIGIKSISATLKEVEERIAEGFKLIKIKCGLNVDGDIAKIEAVRKKVAKEIVLCVDANQGYSLKQARKFIDKVAKYKLVFIEQPIEKDDLENLKYLHKYSPIPIIADESAMSLESIYKLLLGDYVTGVNIKLMKCGGPINFLKIFHLAKFLKKKIMIGCMYESNISITTSGSLALALPIDYVDLDSGHLDFKDDPAKGGVKVEKGKIFLNEKLKY